MRFHGIEHRIADVVHVPAEAFKEFFLERKYHKHSVNGSFQFPGAALVPGPDLGRDVVKHFNLVDLRPGSDALVEAAIVDEDHHVGIKAKYFHLTTLQVA